MSWNAVLRNTSQPIRHKIFHLCTEMKCKISASNVWNQLDLSYNILSCTCIFPNVSPRCSNPEKCTSLLTATASFTVIPRRESKSEGRRLQMGRNIMRSIWIHYLRCEHFCQPCSNSHDPMLPMSSVLYWQHESHIVCLRYQYTIKGGKCFQLLTSSLSPCLPVSGSQLCPWDPLCERRRVSVACSNWHQVNAAHLWFHFLFSVRPSWIWLQRNM